MSIHRRAAKRDAVAKEIVATLRAHGCVVWEVSGTGLPDLIVLKNGRTWLADTKSKAGKATPAQEKKWKEAAIKARVAVFILRTPAHAVAMINSALQPWEPKVLPSSSNARGATPHVHAPSRRDPVTGLPPAYYVPPRQPPGAPSEAEVFAPPPAMTDACSRVGCGHPMSAHPVIFSGDNDQCADCACPRYLRTP